MEQTINALQKRRMKRQQIIFGIFLFVLGLLLGMLIGSMAAEPEQIVSLPDSPSAADNLMEQGTETDFSDLPWNLQLVNFEHFLPYDFEPKEMEQLPNGDLIDSRVLEQAKKMFADAKAQGIRILCVSGYRSFDRQKNLYEEKVKKLQKSVGYSVKKAREEAAKEVAIPGTSEHQLGLALDLTDASYTGLDKKQETTAAYQWLKKHCHEYGFIVRYPAGKTDITGIIYEPWHFRYVGMEAAAEIMEEGITLEEYLGCAPL